MPLIDTGTHLHDPETGQNYARGDSHNTYRKKLRKFRSPYFWDTLFGLYCLSRGGHSDFTIPEIAKKMKVPLATVRAHATNNDWAHKADAINKRSAKGGTSELELTPGGTMAMKLMKDQQETRENLSHAAVRLSRHIRGLPPQSLMKRTKEVKDVMDIGKGTQGWEKDESKGGAPIAGPVLNLNFLMTEGMKAPVVREV